MTTDTIRRGLTYEEATHDMRAHGHAIRRQHWCSPIVAVRQGAIVLDDEGELKPWHPTKADRDCVDWETMPDPETREALLAAMAMGYEVAAPEPGKIDRAALIAALTDKASDGWSGDAVAIDPEQAADVFLAFLAGLDEVSK